MNRYTVNEAAAELGVHPSRVRAMIYAGQFPHAEQIGPVWTITPGDLAKVRVRKPGRPPTKKPKDS